jgi:archaellum biogenesis protein FlaJ (TadC family)
MQDENLTEAKTWQEIKLRNPSQEICDTMQFVITDFAEISASKALQKLILNYPVQKNRIETLEETSRDQKQQIRKLEYELAEQKRLISSIRQSYKQFTALLSE